MLQELFKNKGSSADCECYRDILLGNISGKPVTKIIRKRVMPHARKICHHTQYGSGFNGGETAFAHLYIRMVFDMCKHNHLSAAFIFMDIVTAFAVLIRRIIFDDVDNDEMWLRKLRNSGFSEQDIDAIYSSICAHAWIEEKCPPKTPMANAFRILYSNTLTATINTLGLHRNPSLVS